MSLRLVQLDTFPMGDVYMLWGQRHNRTRPDTTGHDRTRPDTKPDISDTAENDTVQNTPDTTGHYRT